MMSYKKKNVKEYGEKLKLWDLLPFPSFFFTFFVNRADCTHINLVNIKLSTLPSDWRTPSTLWFIFVAHFILSLNFLYCVGKWSQNTK